MGKLTRRLFSRTVAAGVVTALGASRVAGANERIRLGFIGLGNRGDQVLDAFLKHNDQEVAAICDLHPPYLDFAGQKIGNNPKQFKDYRKLLELNDAISKPAIAAPAPRSSPISRTRRSRISSATRAPNSSPTTRRRWPL